MAQVKAFDDGLNVVGLMLVRNEEWIIGASLRAALQWCDQVVLTFDRCVDQSVKIACKVSEEVGGRRVMFHVLDPRLEGTPPDLTKPWDEMHVRHENFTIGRLMGGSHFAIIDADEIPTANVVPHLRNWLRNLSPGQILDLPMVPVWGSGVYRDDRSVWSTAWLTTAFKDKPDLHWKAAADGYHHHARPPKGALDTSMRPIKHGQGGIMHMQFANTRRLLAKHVLYRMVDHLRWPGRESIAKLNWKYDLALSAPEKLTPAPGEWEYDVMTAGVDLYGVPWQEAEIVRLLRAHGLLAFQGLDLKGFTA